MVDASTACREQTSLVMLCRDETFRQGGVTPSIGDIEGALLAVQGSRTKVHVLIRPRPGDFVYSSLEKQVHDFAAPAYEESQQSLSVRALGECCNSVCGVMTADVANCLRSPMCFSFRTTQNHLYLVPKPSRDAAVCREQLQ